MTNKKFFALFIEIKGKQKFTINFIKLRLLFIARFNQNETKIN